MQIYIQIPFSIFQPGFATERTKKGRRRCRQRPNSKSMFNRKHYGWSESHQTLSVQI